MYTQIFDDGSTATTHSDGRVTATQSPPGMLLTDYASNFSPSSANERASTWADVLKYGFGRVIDYKTASLAPGNTAPQFAPVRPDVRGNSIFQDDKSALWLGIGAIALVVLLATLFKDD